MTGPAPTPTTRSYRLFARYVAFCERHTGVLLLALALVAAGALTMALRLELHTDMAELLPDEHPAVLALRRIAGRQKSATNLVMLIHSPSEEANRKFAEAIRPELAKMVPTAFSEIQWKPETEIADYAARYKWLYADEADLDHAEELLDRIVNKRSNPLAVDLEGDPDHELKQLREKLNQKLPVRKEAPYFQGVLEGQHYLGVMMWRRLGGLATRGDRDTLDQVQRLVAQVDPKKLHPQMGVEFTGGIAQAIDEQNGIKEDLTIATVLCTTLVMLAIWLYFRRFALLLVIGAPAVLGLLLSLTIASVTVHYLNINTAFLISIILGNGINSPIVLLARYGEERRREQPVAQALATAMSETLLGTMTAMAAASIAYGCLLLTSFRGFNQFGLLGGAGMLLVWIVTFVLVPPMVITGERLKPGLLTPRGNLWTRPFAVVGELTSRRTVSSQLPKHQAEKLETLARVRRKIDRHKSIMDADELKEVEAWRPPDYLRPLGIDDLPRQVREAFTETDGQRGRLVGIDADHTTYYDWNGHDLLRMSKALQVDALGKRWVAASAATVFAGMLETIIADGPRVTAVALCAVTLLVVVAFGLRGGLPVLVSLGIGIVWLGGALGVLKLKINFMNFVALPITLGVGADYAANIWARLREEGPRNITRVIADTGSAVALCSLTTIIGYSSLLMSHNRALRSFGLLADLGEVTCLMAALVALPAVVKLMSRKG